MRRILIFLVLFMATSSSPAIAQAPVLPDLEIISPANIEQIKELMRWESIHRGFVAAAFSPDGQVLALVLNDGSVRLLSVPSLEQVQVLSGANTEGSQLSFSSDGTRLLLSHWDGTYHLWNVHSGELIGDHSFQFDEFPWSEASANLQVVAALDRTGTITIWNLSTGGEQSRIGLVSPLPRPQLSPDGSLVISADHAADACVWDTTTGNLVFVFPRMIDGELEGVGFSSDGTMMWTNWRNWLLGRDTKENQSVIQFWAVSTGKRLFRLEGGGEHVRMYFDPTGHMIATAGESDRLTDTVWVWNLDTRQLIGEAGIPTGGGSASFSPDGQLLAVAPGTDPSVQVWDPTEPDTLVKVRLETGGSAAPPNSAPTAGCC
jgi:WD40 repeat protein